VKPPTTSTQTPTSRRGSALIVVLWTVMILSLLVSTFLFEMHLEAQVVSHRRRKLQAEALAQAGLATARALLSGRGEAAGEDWNREDPFQLAFHRLQRGLPVQGYREELINGSFELSLVPENARRNVNRMTEEEWLLLLHACRVPESKWSALIDCFMDWTDENDLHRLNGAESDDPWYQERGYKVKNRPLDSVDELLLIKSFTEEIVFGGLSEEGEMMSGLADKLTVFGAGRVNINSAPLEVLLSLPALDQATADDIILLRRGIDGEEGTEDDGFESLEEIGADSRTLTVGYDYIRVRATGQAGSLTHPLECVLRTGEGDPVIMTFLDGIPE